MFCLFVNHYLLVGFYLFSFFSTVISALFSFQGIFSIPFLIPLYQVSL